MPRPSKRAMGQILPGFWIGRMAAVRAIFELQRSTSEKDEEEEWSVVSLMSSETMIRTITETLQQEQDAFLHQTGRKLVQHHVVWDMPDKANAPFVSAKLEEIVRFIGEHHDNAIPTGKDRPKRNCLVHCARGVSRSAAVCAAYLISTQKYTLQTAMEEIQKVRDVNPNLGFLAGLRAIEKCKGDILQAEQRLKKKSLQQESPSRETSTVKASTTSQLSETDNGNQSTTVKASRDEAQQLTRENANYQSIASTTTANELLVPPEGQFSDEVSC